MSSYCVKHQTDTCTHGRHYNDPQPLPIKTDEEGIWFLVIRDMRERDKAGFEKYGTRLQAHNGRDHLIDAYQEALDLVVYLRAEIEKRNV
jgi:hypothetical protein